MTAEQEPHKTDIQSIIHLLTTYLRELASQLNPREQQARKALEFAQKFSTIKDEIIALGGTIEFGSIRRSKQDVIKTVTLIVPAERRTQARLLMEQANIELPAQTQFISAAMMIDAVGGRENTSSHGKDIIEAADRTHSEEVRLFEGFGWTNACSDLVKFPNPTP